MKLNKEKLNEALELAIEHQQADRFIAGDWIVGSKDSDGFFRGCFYGCMVQSDNDPIETFCEKYELPLWLGYWSERVFEGLELNTSKKWPVELLRALVNFEGDIEVVEYQLAVKRLSFLAQQVKDEKTKNAINGVIDYHKKHIGDDAAEIDWPAEPVSTVRSEAWNREREWMLEILGEQQ